MKNCVPKTCYFYVCVQISEENKTKRQNKDFSKIKGRHYD